jgi:hypothetical protein
MALVSLRQMTLGGKGRGLGKELVAWQPTLPARQLRKEPDAWQIACCWLQCSFASPIG